jgi:tetratricopeptide (TPR) repeat protein
LSAEGNSLCSLIVSTKRFRVALSFPGEKRDFIRQVADLLATAIGKKRVLYDDYLTAELARLELDVYLGKLYREESELVVPFLCADYERKKWCKLEWRQMRDILFNVEGHRIMPFRFDDAPITGFLSIDGYVEIGNRTPKDVADLILQRIGASAPVASVSQPQIAPTRLRHGAEKLFGREDELKHLDEAWNDPHIRVATFVAFGGVGKTALIFEWMNRLSADGWHGAERVFDWTFYSQGTREQGAASSDSFVARALEFFGDPEMAKSGASPWDKGARLAQLVAQTRSLLVLDGLEPLQYPPGPMAGKLKDPAIETLLKGLARQNSGLCIVTTRETVSDLAPFHSTTAPEWKLDQLSDDTGAALLEKLGVNGPLAERRQLSHDVNGHALTLNLMGSYLARAFGGDIRKRDQIQFEKADANVQGGHAFKAMAAYEKWLAGGGEAGQRQLAVLRISGLFDYPVSAEILAVLRRKPAIAHLTKPLVGLNEEDWNITLTALADSGLTFFHDNKSSVDTHPLIREYFAAQIYKTNLVGWRSAHRRLYEYLCAVTLDKPQPTLKELQPLYEAVTHGCQAGMQQEVCDNVYFARIRRRDESYTTKKLGAFGSELGAVACFFEQPWVRVSPSLKEGDQAWLLHEAAFCLRALGRLGEAIEPMRSGLQFMVSKKYWKNAATSAGNLSEIELLLGEVPEAVKDGEQSVIYANRVNDSSARVKQRVKLADALHQAGNRGKAEEIFNQAAKIQAKREPNNARGCVKSRS